MAYQKAQPRELAWICEQAKQPLKTVTFVVRFCPTKLGLPARSALDGAPTAMAIRDKLPVTPSNLPVDARMLSAGDGTDPLATLVRVTPMPMIVTDHRQPDSPIVFVNDAFCQMTGYEREEMVGRNCRFLQGPETNPETLQMIREAIRNARTVKVDIRNHRKNGEPFWNRVVLQPVFDNAGALTYFCASQEDVTLELERVKGLEDSNATLSAELAHRLQALEAAEDKLHAAAEAGDLGIWELDLTRQELIASAHFKRNFGRDESAPFTYGQFLGAVHEDDQSRVRAAVAQTLVTGDDYRIEHRIVRPDGQLAWVRVRARLKRDNAGRALYLSGSSQDITEAMLVRRRSDLLMALDRDVFGIVEDPAEIAYRSAEALGQVLDVSRAGYGTIDMLTETIAVERDWNAPGIQSLAGTLRFRDYGSYIEDLKRGETVVFSDACTDPRTRDNADALIAISMHSAVNMPITESNGLVALLYLNHATARPWTADEMALVREVAHRVRQAVERRRAELHLRDLAASLEDQVKERAMALMQTEAALRQSQKMEAVGQLTGGLAHDFNNLLAAISGSFELLKRLGQAQPGLTRYVEMGQTATKRAAALTHRLLAFSRQQTLEPKHIEVNGLVTGFKDLVQRTIGPQVILEVVAGIGIWPVHADPGQLENSLLNLCINARDAMPDGGRLVVETANRAMDEHTAGDHGMLPGQYVLICVSDSGTGMPPEVIAHAFDPFFTTKPIGVGTGLGLSMVYGFARQSGGHAHIYSEVGIGTTVCIYLPRYHGEVSEDATPDAEAAPADLGDGQTILVVDDEASVRALMVEVLRDLGYRVLQAESGPRAIQLLQTDGSIVLLVTDVGLPGGMNGRQVADMARRVKPELQVLFVTGYAENAALSQGQLPAGMQVLTKPFELNVFGQRVQTLIKSSGMPAQSANPDLSQN